MIFFGWGVIFFVVVIWVRFLLGGGDVFFWVGDDFFWVIFFGGVIFLGGV